MCELRIAVSFLGPKDAARAIRNGIYRVLGIFFVVKASNDAAKASRRFCSVVVITPDFDSTIIPATPVRIWARPHEYS